MLYVPCILLDIITVLPRASLRRGVLSMNIQQLPVSSLINYEFNARRHDQTQIDRIATSIKEFGFNQPVVVDESNIILVGHGRVAAARKLGLETIPVLKKEGLTESQKKAYRVLDNKLQNDSTWDLGNLELDLGFMEDSGIDLESWGLDSLRELFEQVAESPDGIDVSKIETQFRIEITCMSEGHQKEVYEKLKEEGLECRLLTL